ncbi:MAG TPA: immune inhibitor A [Candidatus Sabulitectum sp.]|nr:immune inhibitor A [Candidatus Sabulitectum sp.]HPJ28703.1 immune inhibitor A [Candidatus Sabulitectum sp.]HPR22331.1 immune inhibitor A [Candidatus Sabulitectum sp.]
MKKQKNGRGMSLIELMIVIGILGILFTAVYMFFTKGTEQFHFARRQNQLATQGRLALEIISDEIRWAGYMPAGGWPQDQWHPIEVAEENQLQFYADFDWSSNLTDEDHRNVFRGTDDIVRITDDASYSIVAGTDITALQFNFFDAQGNLLAKPLNATDRDAVRHIQIKLTLQDTYMGDVYQTVLQTMVTPLNLGVQHNFDPLFYLPPQTPGNILVNVYGEDEPVPTNDEQALIEKLIAWGHRVEILVDSEVPVFPYDSLPADLLILRDINTFPGIGHFADSVALQAIPIPIIVLDPDDAVRIFHMAYGATDATNHISPMAKVIVNHDIHYQVPRYNSSSLTFSIYDSLEVNAPVNFIDSLAPGTDLITRFTGIAGDSLSGVSVINDFLPSSRRIHYCAPAFEHYCADGDRFLYNVIKWGLGSSQSEPPLGDEIERETFEGESPGEIDLTIWEDDLEGGVMMPDSIPIYTDFEPSGAPGMVWTTTSTGSGAITRLGDNTLEMERTVSGAFDRNIAAASVDLSPYNALTDDLYITVDSWKGTSETINAEDGVFLYSMGGSVTELVNEDFESLLLAGGDVEFWGDLYGRHRVHSPGWNNGTSFVTLDTRVNGNYGRARMIIEVDTSTLDDGTPITVYFRMSDQGDENNNYNSSTGSGDYVGWSLGEDIADPIEDYIHLSPQSYTNGQWYDREFTFTPPGTMPSTLYVIFSQYDDRTATSATGSDGISFDDVVIVADNSTLTLSRVGVPSTSADWQPIGVDLDDQAVIHGAPFTADYGIALSQYGLGPWSTYGMHWRNFEIGYIDEYYTLPGWTHGPVAAGGTDDWLLEEISGDHRWTLHANDPTHYSNSTDCWLQAPEFSIPAGASDARLTISHQMELESGYDYAWIEVSTNGGSTWQFFESDAYTPGQSYNGHDAFSGTISPSTLNLSLEDYVGQSITLRFMFHSDGSVTRSGWVLDDFHATCKVVGIAVQAIGFKPVTTGGSWVFDNVDVWLGGVSADEFTGSGEWNKGELTFAGTYTVNAPVGEWAVINLSEDFILPESRNLLVKLEMNQASPATGYEWVAEPSTNMSRWATSGTADPSDLNLGSVRPALMVSLLDHGDRFVFQSAASSSPVMPLAFNSIFGDFEGIYTLAELGFSGEVAWVHGGTNDDWEIGAPIFTPDIDPALAPINENSIAGNDLTDDGNYDPNAWCWIRSGAYDLSEAAAYDSIAMSYDRCLRRSFNDLAFIQMAFTDTDTPPTSESDWITVKTCDYDDTNWTGDVLQLTFYFDQAIADGKNYYFVRFVLSSGPWAEKGGWNIDNVGFYGRNGI